MASRLDSGGFLLSTEKGIVWNYLELCGVFRYLCVEKTAEKPQQVFGLYKPTITL